MRVAYRWEFAVTAIQHLPYVLVTEDAVAHSQFSTSERTHGDTNGHQIGHHLQ